MSSSDPGARRPCVLPGASRRGGVLGLARRRPRSIPRRAALALALAGLAACGFQPAYGPGGAGTRLQGQVRAMDPRTSDDFVFNRRIAERLGPAEAGRYALDYRITVAPVAQGITPDQVITRYTLSGTVDFTLSQAGTQRLKGRVSSFTSWSATGTTIATLAAERDARERLARMLADQVVTRLLAVAP